MSTRLAWRTYAWRCPECNGTFRSREVHPFCYDCEAAAVPDGVPVPQPERRAPVMRSEPVGEDPALAGLRCDSCGAYGNRVTQLIYVAPCLPGGGRRLCRVCLSARDAALSTSPVEASRL